MVSAWIEIHRGKGQGGASGRLISIQYILNAEPLLRDAALVMKKIKIKLPTEAGNYTLCLRLKAEHLPDPTTTDTRWFTVKVKKPTSAGM